MDIRTQPDLDRRTVLKGAAAGAVGVGAAGTLAAGGIEGVSPAPAAAEDKHAVKDPTLITESVKFKSGDAMINGFIARPKAAGKYGTVILIPDIFGMTDYARESTAQLAQAGLAAIAVDFYSRSGPPPQDFAQLRQFVGQNAPDRQIVDDGLAAIHFMKTQPYVGRKFGVTGFCMGGRITLLLAAHSADIAAASPYYGPVLAASPTNIAPMDLTEKIRGAVQGHYGGTDMNPKPDDVRAFYDKLKKTNAHAEFFIYQRAGHAFHSYSRPSYNPEAATSAWNRTLAFFQQTLK